MSTVRINNHMSRILPLRRPYPKGKMGLVVPMTAFNSQTVVIHPGKFEYIDFWDEIKNHPIYQNYLDRGLISVGEDATLEKGGSAPFTSFGDTMEAADSLDPEIDDEEAAEVNMEIERGTAEPAKKRGKRTKVKAEAEEATEQIAAGGQNHEQN